MAEGPHSRQHAMSSGASGAADRSSLENRLSGEEFEVDVRFARAETCFRVFNPLKYHLSDCPGLTQSAELLNRNIFY